MPNQRIVLLKAGGHVNHIPKASPALKPTQVHVEQDWAFGGANQENLSVIKYTMVSPCVNALVFAVVVVIRK